MRSTLGAGLLGGLAAGVLHIAFAVVLGSARSQAPAQVLQTIAASVLGQAAFRGGAAAAALGAVLHFGLSIVMGLGFVGLARLVPALLKRPILSGAAYGAFLFIVMSLVVAPLSAAGGALPSGWLLLVSAFAHIALVGVPIAAIAALLLAPTPGAHVDDTMVS